MLNETTNIPEVIQADLPNEAPATNALIGETIAERYRLLSTIGTGRVSSVYRAQEITSAKLVAVKVLDCTSANFNEESLKLFESNARLNFQHPNLLTVLSCGILPDGRPWLAYELFESRTLADLLSTEGYLTSEAASELWNQILDALSYIHGKGEVHMNLKPSNILIASTSEGKPYVKLADFGIAKVLLERELQVLGEHDIPDGSPLFMSPEQFKGERIDARADVYSLGCLFFKMLTGHAPFEGVSLLETMDKQMEQAVEFPSEPELDEHLTEVLKRMLSKNPGERQRSAGEVKNELQSAIAMHSHAATYNDFAAAQRASRVTGWKRQSTKKGREPWPLLLWCITVLLLVAITQQCLALVRDYVFGRPGHAYQHVLPSAAGDR